MNSLSIGKQYFLHCSRFELLFTVSIEPIYCLFVMPIFDRYVTLTA